MWTVVNPISIGSRVIDNASFLGTSASSVICDGRRLSGPRQASIPATCRGHRKPADRRTTTQINENPPDGGVTNESADASQIGTLRGRPDGQIRPSFPFQHPSQGVDGFGLMPGGVNYQPLFAAQLVYALLVDAAHDVDATVRVVDEPPSTDNVYIGEH